MSEQVTVTLTRYEAITLSAELSEPFLDGTEPDIYHAAANKIRTAIDSPQPAPEGEDGDWPELIEAVGAVLGESAESIIRDDPPPARMRPALERLAKAYAPFDLPAPDSGEGD